MYSYIKKHTTHYMYVCMYTGVYFIEQLSIKCASNYILSFRLLAMHNLQLETYLVYK